MSTGSSKIPYYKVGWFIHKWVLCGGADGCEIVDEAELASDKPPPKPAQPKTPSAASKPVPKPDAATKMLNDLQKAANAFSRFQAWLDTPDTPKPTTEARDSQTKEDTVAPFDIQEIPITMRALSLPMGAKLMERWFAGQLNYSPDDQAESRGLNQNGEPYPPSMIDKTNVTMKWALGFERAKAQYENLVHNVIYSQASLQQLAKILQRYPPQTNIDARSTQIEDIHTYLQFERAGVESTWSQKLEQARKRAVEDRGVPDDLTAALGSFTFYVAIERAFVNARSATVSEISVYIKDNYTFTTDPGSVSQYLGHWSSKGVIVVPPTEGSTLANRGWANFAVKLGDPKVKGNVYYPVRNSDFRKWQVKHRRGGDFIIYSNRIVLLLLLRPIKVLW